MSRRTVIRDGDVVWFDGRRHTLARDRTLVIDGATVTGLVDSYDGRADVELSARGQLVIPGLIDTHVHTGTRATHRLIVDSGRRDYWSQPYWHWTVARPGAHAPGDVRYDGAVDAERNPDRLAARFTAAELLSNGTTTFFEVGSRVSLLRALADAVEEIGVRGYLGAGYQSTHILGTESGQYRYETLPDGGEGELREALAFVEELEAAPGGLARGALVPRESELVSEELLRRTAELARSLGVPVQTHAAYAPQEWFRVVQEHGCTPIELLERNGLLGPTVIVGHGQLVAENPLSNWAGGRDLEILGESGTTVAHSPVNLMRRGRALDHFDRYRAAGINLALGTDTFPRDLITQMRMASYCGKVMARDFAAASAADVFEAATLGGARALGRDDLGRICVGSTADLALVALRAPGSLRYGVIRDPLHALVDCGIGDDVRTVLVDGEVRMRDRRIAGVDLEELGASAQRHAERYWATVAEWDPLRRDAEQQSPLALPLYEETAPVVAL